MTWTPARTTMTGTAVLMACACGAGNSSAKLLKMGGMDVTSKVTHSLLLGIGALLIARGLWQIERKTAFIASLSFLALIAGAAITPPMMMSAKHEPWAAAQAGGALFYLLFAALLIYAFWIAFPRPAGTSPVAVGVGMGGTAVATGCSCCMVTGAIAGLAVTAGGSPNSYVFLKWGLVYFTGIAIAAVGLTMMRGVRPLPWLIAGAVVTRWGGDALKIFGDWMVGDVNLRFIPGYAMYLIGAGLVLKAWAVAYEPVTEPEPLPAETLPAY